jgi:hypothetical protein
MDRWLPRLTSVRRGRCVAHAVFVVCGTIAACGTEPSPGPRVAPPLTAFAAPEVAAAPRGPCAVEYKALLDLAVLARNYGPSAGVFLDPLGDMFDQLDRCLSATEGAEAASQAGIVRIGTDR